jgi:hypothetical protein
MSTTSPFGSSLPVSGKPKRLHDDDPSPSSFESPSAEFPIRPLSKKLKTPSKPHTQAVDQKEHDNLQPSLISGSKPFNIPITSGYTDGADPVPIQNIMNSLSSIGGVGMGGVGGIGGGGVSRRRWMIGLPTSAALSTGSALKSLGSIQGTLEPQSISAVNTSNASQASQEPSTTASQPEVNVSRYAAPSPKMTVQQAISYLQSLLPPNIPPLILTPQLYALCDSNTIVDTDIASLCAKGELRRIKIGNISSSHLTFSTTGTSRSALTASTAASSAASSTGGAGGTGPVNVTVPEGIEYAVLKNSQYLERVQQALHQFEKLHKPKPNPASASSTYNFRNGSTKKPPSIAPYSSAVLSGSGSRTRTVHLDLYQRFLRFLQDPSTNITTYVSRDVLNEAYGLSDADVAELVSSGFLLLKDAKEVWLGVPSAGGFVGGFVKGRQEILGMLRRNRFKERERAVSA